MQTAHVVATYCEAAARFTIALPSRGTTARMVEALLIRQCIFSIRILMSLAARLPAHRGSPGLVLSSGQGGRLGLRRGRVQWPRRVGFWGSHQYGGGRRS